MTHSKCYKDGCQEYPLIKESYIPNGKDMEIRCDICNEFYDIIEKDDKNNE